MWNVIKKILTALIVIWAVSLTLNLNFGGRPAREWTSEVWNSEPVQAVYQEVKARALAVLNKDISVEEAFEKDRPGSDKFNHPKTNLQAVDLDKLSAEDKEKLKEILEKNK